LPGRHLLPVRLIAGPRYKSCETLLAVTGSGAAANGVLCDPAPLLQKEYMT